tara:strand:+ start:1057 stop:1962 length:906 start_codon:yes stop_codon:yes gene_type:complete
MKITNNFGMPQPFVDFAINDKYSKGKADISVTTLIDSPKIRLMKEKHDHQIEVDAVDMVWALFGTAVHSVLENSKQSEDSITEERLYSTVSGWVLSGAVDRQEIKDDNITIVDYKVTSVWSVIYGKPEWENQLNCYAYLVNDKHAFNKSKVTNLKICAILRDWNRRDAERKEDYPKAPIVFVDIPLWDHEKASKYIIDRMALHQEAQILADVHGDLGLCSAEEMWKKNDTWAVKKKGQKRALRVLDSEEEAIKYIEWHNETDKAYTKKTDLEIEFRGGEYTRCGNYCSVADFCNQYKTRKL